MFDIDELTKIACRPDTGMYDALRLRHNVSESGGGQGALSQVEVRVPWTTRGRSERSQ